MEEGGYTAHFLFAARVAADPRMNDARQMSAAPSDRPFNRLLIM